MTEDSHDRIDCPRCGANVSRGLLKDGGCSVCDPEIPIEGADADKKGPLNMPGWYQRLVEAIDEIIPDEDANEYIDRFLELTGMSPEYFEKIQKKSFTIGGAIGEVLRESFDGSLAGKPQVGKSIHFVPLETIIEAGHLFVPPDTKVLRINGKGVFLETDGVVLRKWPLSPSTETPAWYSLAWWDVDLQTVVDRAIIDEEEAVSEWNSMMNRDESWKGVFSKVEDSLGERDDELFTDYEKFLEWIGSHPNVRVIAKSVLKDESDEDED